MNCFFQDKLRIVFTERIPKWQDVLSVYAVIVFLVYSWTLFAFIYNVPSWLFFLTPGQILSIYAYTFIFDWLESLLLLSGIFLLEYTLLIFLAKTVLFKPRATLYMIFFMGFVAARLYLFKSYIEPGFLQTASFFAVHEAAWWQLLFAIGVLVSVLVPNIRVVGNFLGDIAERSVIFLYIYLPMTLMSLIVVIIRAIQ